MVGMEIGKILLGGGIEANRKPGPVLQINLERRPLI